jgi:hypothetical protein
MKSLNQQTKSGSAQRLEQDAVEEVCLSVEKLTVENSSTERPTVIEEIGNYRIGLLPLLFGCFNSSFANCAVVAEKLQSKLPEGTCIFGFQEAWWEPPEESEDDMQSSPIFYDYRVLLWPPLLQSSAVKEQWRTLLDTGVWLDSDKNEVGSCVIPDGLEGLTTAQAGRTVLSRLVLAESIARKNSYPVRWFGDLPFREVFSCLDSGA